VARVAHVAPGTLTAHGCEAVAAPVVLEPWRSSTRSVQSEVPKDPKGPKIFDPCPSSLPPGRDSLYLGSA